MIAKVRAQATLSSTFFPDVSREAGTICRQSSQRRAALGSLQLDAFILCLKVKMIPAIIFLFIVFSSSRAILRTPRRIKGRSFFLVSSHTQQLRTQRVLWREAILNVGLEQ